MIPRLKTSKKWTTFPAEFQENILKTFEESFSKKLAPGQFIVESRIYSAEILFRVGFLEKGRLFQANFEASVDYKGMDGATEAINLCIDSTASMLEQYFESQQLMDMPRDWKEFEFEKRKVYLRFSTINTALEAEADKILGLHDDHLIQEHQEDENQESELDKKIKLQEIKHKLQAQSESEITDESEENDENSDSDSDHGNLN